MSVSVQTGRSSCRVSVTEAVLSGQDFKKQGMGNGREFMQTKAITGTKTDKRDEFLRMIEDCMNGQIDVVITNQFPDSPEILWTH